MHAARSWRWFVPVCVALAACSSSGGATTGTLDGAVRADGSAADRAGPDVGAFNDVTRVPTFDVPVRDAPDTPLDGSVDAPDALPLTTLADGAVTACGPRERCGNGIDDDCNGMTDEGCACVPGMTQPCFPGDALLAGHGACVYGMQHCTGPGEFGTWAACEGYGHPTAVDCRMPTLDNRCDGHPGVGCLCAVGASRGCYAGPMGTQGRGLCRAGTQSCAVTATGSAWGACVGEVLPVADACDGRDTDCDGTLDTGCGCARGATRSCYSGAAGTSGRGLCHGGMQTCVTTINGAGTVWGPCGGEVVPARDVCNGVDRDCDGNPNTGCACTIDATEVCYTGPAGTQNVGLCRPGTRRCNALVQADGSIGSVWGACLAQTLPGAAEVCGNSIDDDCDGMVDEGCTAGCAAGTLECSGRCIDVRSDVANCGACAHACAVGQACVNGACVGNGMLRVTMVWDLAGDMDLHVVPPCGTEIYYGHLSACGGTLNHDDTSTTGPENIFWAATPDPGTYLVCADPFRLNGATTGTVTVTQGSTVLHTWPVARTASSGNVTCSRTSPYFVGEFTY